MRSVKISIIIPMYNTEKYIGKTLQSVMSQSLTDIQIIVVNDGSTDEGVSVVREKMRTDSRIELYEQPNSGPSVSRNKAIQYACGEYIYYLDSDDILKAGALQAMADYCDATQCDFCFFDGEVITEKGSATRLNTYHRCDLFEEYKAYHGIDLLNQMLDNYKYRAVVWLLCIRRSFLDKISIEFLNGIIHEDELFLVLLTLQAQKIYCLNQRLICHRQRSESIMGTKFSVRNIECYVKVFDNLFAFAKQSGKKEINAIIDKFARFTLNAVISKAHTIELKEKIYVAKIFFSRKYWKYITFHDKMVFLFKR